MTSWKVVFSEINRRDYRIPIDYYIVSAPSIIAAIRKAARITGISIKNVKEVLYLY